MEALQVLAEVVLWALTGIVVGVVIVCFLAYMVVSILKEGDYGMGNDS